MTTAKERKLGLPRQARPGPGRGRFIVASGKEDEEDL